LPAHRRAAALAHVSDCIAARAEELHAVIRDENGKLIMWARAEVTRAASTVRWAAEEARRWSSSLQRLDTDPTGEGRLAVVRRFPRGPVLGISPFNFPLNLVAHKVAPALAVGAPIVMKPAPKTPLSALLLGKLLSETDLPAGSWSLLIALDAAMPDWWPICACQWCLAPAPDPSAGRSAPRSRPSTSPSSWGQRRSPGRLRLVVAGKPSVGRPTKRPLCDLWAGQSCVSVQRVHADQSVHDALLSEVILAVERLGTGLPSDPETVVGPLINVESADRVCAWIARPSRAGPRCARAAAASGRRLSRPY